MEQLLDFFARFGDVAFGILAFVAVMLVAIAIVIELIDFLIVDPIKRNQTPPAEDDNVLFDSEEK